MTPDPAIAIFRPRCPDRETLPRMNPAVLERDLDAEPLGVHDQLTEPCAMRLKSGDSVLVAAHAGAHHRLCWAAGRSNLLLIDAHDLAPMPL